MQQILHSSLPSCHCNSGNEWRRPWTPSYHVHDRTQTWRSIRSYNRHCSAQQQKCLSATLSRVATGEVVASSAMTPVQQGIAPQNCMSQNLPFGLGIGFQRHETQSSMSNVLTNAGILKKSMFSNCFFTINLPAEAQKWTL